ncbi:MAG TPA: glycosyltransferase family 2 protein [Candidatus Limnocylindrales bacterium]
MTDRTEAAESSDGSVSHIPAVSVCIPTFNGAPWILEAIESALAQEAADLEVVVCDDASTDNTLELVRQVHDDRVRVIANSERVGLARNWNRSVRESRGSHIKFLMQDDRLAPDCVGRMLELFAEDPAIGMVFCARELVLDEPKDPASVIFARRFGELHTRLGPLARVNDGQSLYAAMQRDRFRDNMIGEPTAVMVTRDALLRLGLFNIQMRQLTDLEMWLRIALFYRMGFVAAPLATFRVHANSASSSNARSGSGWLDRVWLLEGLRAKVGFRIWLLTYANAGKRLVTDGPRAVGPHLRELGLYLRFRLRRRRDPLHEWLAGRPLSGV